MAITFIKKRKKQKYLVLIVLGVVVVSLIILWRGYFKKEAPLPTPAVSGPHREIKVDFGILENPFLKEIQPFEKIPPFEGETGRENPFLPY